MWYCNTPGLLFRGPVWREYEWVSVNDLALQLKNMKHIERARTGDTECDCPVANFPETWHEWHSSTVPLLPPQLWTQTFSNKYSTSMRHPRATWVLIYLKIEGQCCTRNFQSAVERKCNINTICPAQSLCNRGWSGIPGVVEHPLKLSSFATRMWLLIFSPLDRCGRCCFC